MGHITETITQYLPQIDRRILVLILTILLIALFVLAAGAPTGSPPGG